MKKIVLLAFVLLLLSTAAVVRFVRPVADSLVVHNIDLGNVIAQANSTTTVYLDSPTINGTAIGVGNNVMVNLNIFDAVDIYGWQAGLIFNATALECKDFSEGEFLLDSAGPYGTQWIPATINNTAGVIYPHGCTFLGDYKTSGSGRLAYLTFEVKAAGVSDLHLRDVMVIDYYNPVEMVPFNIIDVYTVFVDTNNYTVVTVSNSTGLEIEKINEDIWVCVHSGFYDHAFSLPAEKISFKVTGPYPGFSNITIPKTLLNVSTLDEWSIVIDGILLSSEERTVTCNGTHYFLYFTYDAGIHYVQIATRALVISTISITLSQTSIYLGENLTISGDIDPARIGVMVTILHRTTYNITSYLVQWNILTTLTIEPNSHFNYTWTPETVRTHEFMAMWEGDESTFGDVSDVKTAEVDLPPPIHNIDTDLYYATMQEAINANETQDEHTILVDAGTYYEHVVVNKSISLIGENRSTTIIDGNKSGTPVKILSNNVIVSGFTIRNSSTSYPHQNGIYILSNSCVISNNVITHNNGAGILISGVSNNTIINNTITNNFKGITIFFGSPVSNNTIRGNTIALNDEYGIYIIYSSCNKICLNNFINNRYQTYSTGSTNFWDEGYPLGGNYWSDYNGSDTNSDGIGDSPYIIYSTTAPNQDNYPLMGTFYDFSIDETLPVTVISNSTVCDFGYGMVFGGPLFLHFHVSGPDDTVGFCRVMILRAFMEGPYTVFVDDEQVEANELPISNSTHAFLYFTYQHSTHEVAIVPEFPTWTSMLLLLIVLTVATAVYKRRLLKTTTH